VETEFESVGGSHMDGFALRLFFYTEAKGNLEIAFWMNVEKVVE